MSLEHNISPQWLEAQYQLQAKGAGTPGSRVAQFFEGFDFGSQAGPPATQEDCHRCPMALKQSAIDALVYRYRDIGHLLACTDPLSPCKTEHPLLALEAFGLEEADLERVFYARHLPQQHLALREIIAHLRETYCRAIGVEFMHIQDPAERHWLLERMESTRNRPALDRQEKLTVLRKLQEATLFETFLHRQFLGQKRFSLEGGEVIIPLLDRMVHKATELQIRDLVLGMAHRGRLNVLANIFSKPLENIFAEFADNIEFHFVGEGDVKYHQGFSSDLHLDEGPLHMTLASNPSHLEAVDAVVVGKARARQDELGAEGAQRVLPVLIHGDAAFAGQGMVAETLNLSQLEGYGTGGTLHIVLNNQIGFTTTPKDARSTLYATDVAKMLMVPIFHVHGEDPEAAAYVVDLALDYRQRFGRDLVLEVICYRRQGHNEGDEPYFTQPLMYEKIKQRPTMSELYARRLLEEGIAPREIEDQEAAIRQRLEQAVDRQHQQLEVGYGGKWQDIAREFNPVTFETGVDEVRLLGLAERLAALPESFTSHPRIARLLERRLAAVQEGSGIDWANAEALSFASLLDEGHSVRLSGQDSRRGTFSQRHAALLDITSGAEHLPLATVAHNACFYAYDSPLSESSVLGFEYGYSLEAPYGLTLWEAQFGDFVNGAQVIIDQFIAASERKWNRVSGLVLLLPHGYEGQGPEHSSARIERFLQLCAADNLQVAYPTTPAQLFHLLRRQVKPALSPAAGSSLPPRVCCACRPAARREPS
ncbi:MAG: 2-oxoglutarate dehydrogenase E1 component [Syntrophotaleaceae bacterium]